jgi:uncharacterized protein
MPVTQISLGLRPHHYEEWKSHGSYPPYLEILIDNYLFQEGGPSLGHLAYFSERTQLLFHGVGLDVCGVDPLSQSYLQNLKELCDQFCPKIVSDHLCFNRAGGHQSYDLLPFPYNEYTLARACERVDAIQNYLGREIAVENLSSYVAFVSSTMTEFEFMNRLCKSTACSILLDVNNLFVNSQNFDFNPLEEMHKLKAQFVAQYHVAGHSALHDFLHDSHDGDVRIEVWELLAKALVYFGPHPIVLERDNDAADLQVLLDDVCRGERFLNGT